MRAAPTPPTPRVSARASGAGRRPGPARQSSLREHNLSLVLREVIAARPPTTRARIAAATGLTRATVSQLVDRLIAGRLVVELEPESVERAGRPGVRLAPAPRTLVALGLEIQVDHISVRATDLTGSALAQTRVSGDFRNSDPAQTVDRLMRLAGPVVGQLREDAGTIVGACVAVPGIMRMGSGIVHLAPNLGWADVDLVALLSQHPALADVPVELGNDADLGARAETRVRALATNTPRSAQSFLYIAGEIGIGGAIVIDGELAAGQHGWSGEIGHAVIDPDGPRCGCGARGCLEQFAGKDAIMRAAGLDVTEPVERLIAAAKARDAKALKALQSASTALGIAVSTALNIVDVERVVLAGTYAPLYEWLHEGIEAQVRERVLTARWSPVRVERPLGGDDSALLGAGLRVLDRVTANPAAWLSA